MTKGAVKHSSLTIPPPVEFSFKISDWPSWSRRFRRYRQCSGLMEEEDKKQVSILVYLMGDKAEDILTSFNLPEEEVNKFDTVFKTFDVHFGGKRNIIYERAKFNKRVQGVDELSEDFIRDLHVLAQSCEYGTLKEEIIRDRIVVGINCTQLSEALQLDPNLTLAKAEQKVRQAEEARLPVPRQYLIKPAVGNMQRNRIPILDPITGLTF